jgi:NAD(P)-dependent dehydrogenase (short-subunit alcohol dehydrogenase family)
LFAAEGAHVLIVGRSSPALSRAAGELADAGYEVDTFLADISKRAEAEAVIAHIIARWGGIDVLVNNAGEILAEPLDLADLDDFTQAFGVHFWGPLYLMWSAIPHMRQQGGGRIVNIASIGGKVAVPHLAAYCASKYALVGLSDAFRAELAQGHIAVTTVCPGLMRTGSHLHAQFKGRHSAEFAWFALLDSLRLFSKDAGRAGRQIVEACRAGRPSLTISTQARLLSVFDAACPNTSARVMRLAARVLPRGEPSVAAHRAVRSGAESRPRWMPSMLTRLADEAAERHNQQPVKVPIA